MIATGFTGTPGDGYGHINLQFNNNVPPCTEGYLPPSQWRPATDTSDAPIYPAQCKSGPPLNMRGYNYAPKYGSARQPAGPTGSRRTMPGRERSTPARGAPWSSATEEAAHGVRRRRMEVDADGTGDGR